MFACFVPKPPPESGPGMPQAGVLPPRWRINPFDSGRLTGPFSEDVSDDFCFPLFKLIPPSAGFLILYLHRDSSRHCVF
jgi:hypothetical protein